MVVEQCHLNVVCRLEFFLEKAGQHLRAKRKVFKTWPQNKASLLTTDIAKITGREIYKKMEKGNQQKGISKAELLRAKKICLFVLSYEYTACTSLDGKLTCLVVLVTLATFLLPLPSFEWVFSLRSKPIWITVYKKKKLYASLKPVEVFSPPDTCTKLI